MDFAEKAEEQAREFKRMLEQQTSEEEARRAKEKRLYEEEIIKVREEANRRVEEVSKMAKEIGQRVEEEARRRAEEKRHHEEEIIRLREEANRRVEEVGKMAEETAQRVEEEASRRAEEKRLHEEEVRMLRENEDEHVNRFHRIAQQISKRAEEATAKVQEAIVEAHARKNAAEQQSAILMKESEEKVRRLVEESMTRERAYLRTERHTFIRNSDLDTEVEDRIPIGGQSNWREPVQMSEEKYDNEEEDGGEEEDVDMDLRDGNRASSFSAYSNKTPPLRIYSTPPLGIRLQHDQSEDNTMAAKRMNSQDEDGDKRTDDVGRPGGKKIPLPRRYSAPQGGAAPVNIRLQPVERAQSENNGMAAKTAELHPRERNRRSKKFKQIFGDDEIEEDVIHKRPTKKSLYPQPSLRGYKPVRAARLVGSYVLHRGQISHISLDGGKGVNEQTDEYHSRCANSSGRRCNRGGSRRL
jgi:hypothetical protein